jgi:hypothetical protein
MHGAAKATVGPPPQFAVATSTSRSAPGKPPPPGIDVHDPGICGPQRIPTHTHTRTHARTHAHTHTHTHTHTNTHARTHTQHTPTRLVTGSASVESGGAPYVEEVSAVVVRGCEEVGRDADSRGCGRALHVGRVVVRACVRRRGEPAATAPTTRNSPHGGDTSTDTCMYVGTGKDAPSPTAACICAVRTGSPQRDPPPPSSAQRQPPWGACSAAAPVA